MSINHDAGAFIDLFPDPSKVNVHTIDESDTELFSQWLLIRQRFMEDRGWRSGADHDEYDDNPRTLHVVKERKEIHEIMVGMRLTPCDDVTSSISWSMLAPHLQQQVLQNMPPNHVENTWDLTRLVPGHVQQDEVIDSLLEVFGAGMKLTDIDEHGQPPRWFFATTPSFVALFKRQGLDFIELARGKNSPEDKHDVIFCYADPVDVTGHLRSEGFPAYDAVQRGAHAA